MAEFGKEIRFKCDDKLSIEMLFEKIIKLYYFHLKKWDLNENTYNNNFFR